MTKGWKSLTQACESEVLEELCRTNSSLFRLMDRSHTQTLTSALVWLVFILFSASSSVISHGQMPYLAWFKLGQPILLLAQERST